METHSPSPWKHKPDRDGKGFMTFEAADGTTIVGGCGCCCSPYGCSDEASELHYKPNDADRANAKLIEAAPELYDALELCLMFMTNVNTAEPLEVMQKTIAALKKAGCSDETLDDAGMAILRGAARLR